MSSPFTTSDVENVPDRAPPWGGSKMVTRGFNRSFSRGQEQNFDPGAFSINSQSNSAYRKNDASSLQTQTGRSMHQTELEPRMRKAASQVEEQQTVNNPPADKVESSRRRTADLAEENARLRLEVETLRNEKEDACDAMGKMLSDLIVAQSGLQEKEAVMSRQQDVMNKQNSQLEHLRQNINRLSAELDERKITQMDFRQSSELEQTVSTLRIEIREKDINLREKDHILREREMDWKVELHTLKEEVAQQQQQKEKAVAELQKLQTMVNNQDQNRRAADITEAEAEKARAEQYLHELQQLNARHKAKVAQYLQELQQLRDEIAKKRSCQDRG